MRVFLDANVLFTAAHNPTGKAAFVIKLASEGYFLVFTSDFACDEAERNLAAKYPGCLPVHAEIISHVTVVSAKLSASYPSGLPDKDAIIFQAAATCNATHLLTGDIRHFGAFMNRPSETFSIIVQTTAEFLASLSGPL